MEKGQRVKIKSSGATGTIADGNSKIVNVTIDEKYLQPGDDTTAYLKPDEVEVLEEAAIEEKKTDSQQEESPSVIENKPTLPDADRINVLLKDLFSFNEKNIALEKENEELKAEVTKLTQQLSEKQ